MQADAETHAEDNTVTVIIVNFNAGDRLQACVDSLREQTVQPLEVLVMDNASVDGSADGLDLDALPFARVIRLERNLGFAGANNRAAAIAKGRWLALLNPDAVAAPDWLETLLAAAREHPDTTSFASAQISAEDEGILDGAGDAYFFLGIPWRGGFGCPVADLPGEGECFSPCGASAFIRRDSFLAHGGFEERFFCYCEDVDLGFRMRLAGERCRFVPTARIVHEGSAITGRYSDFTVRLGTRNRFWTYIRNMPPIGLALTLPGHLAASLYLYVRAIGKPHARAMRQGLQDGFAGLPAAWKDRRALARSRKVSSWSILRSMAFDPARLSARKPHVWTDHAGRQNHVAETKPPQSVAKSRQRVPD